MSRSNDNHVIVDLSIASSGSHDDDDDQEDNSQTATSTPIEVIPPSTGSEDKQGPATTALLSHQQQQQQPLRIVQEIFNPEKRTNVFFSASLDGVKVQKSFSMLCRLVRARGEAMGCSQYFRFYI